MTFHFSWFTCCFSLVHCHFAFSFSRFLLQFFSTNHLAYARCHLNCLTNRIFHSFLHFDGAFVNNCDPCNCTLNSLLHVHTRFQAQICIEHWILTDEITWLLFTLQQGSAFDEKSEDYAELPPNQRRKKLLQKIDQIQTQINQETAVRYVTLLNIYSLLPVRFECT